MQASASAGVPAPIEPHRLFSSPDPVLAAQLAEPVLGRHRLTLRDGPVSGFCATLYAVAVGEITLGYLHLAAGVNVELDASADRFLIVQPMTGRIAVRSGGAGFVATPERAFVVQPGRPASMRCPPEATLRVVGIERSPLLVHLSRLLGRALEGPLVFDPELDLAVGASSRWVLAVQVLHAELAASGSLLRSGIGLGPLEEFLMSALLFGQRSSYSEALTTPSSATGSRALAAARQFIEVNLTESLSVRTVASVAGVTPRALQAAFRTQLRTTPTAYIRSRRLDQVRSDLLEAALDPVTVTDVAIRWGFSHLGRFATEYRERFGESPSSTLRRARGTVPCPGESRPPSSPGR